MFGTSRQILRYLLTRLTAGLFNVALLVLLSATVSQVLHAQERQSAARNVEVEQCLTRRETLAQLTGVMVPFEDFEKLGRAAARGELGLVGLLGDPEQADAKALKRNIEHLQAVSSLPLLFGSDEESRAVQRLDRILGKLPSTRHFDKLGRAGLEETYLQYALDMRTLGFQVAFGPVVDVGGGPVLKYRTLGGDGSVVADHADAVVTGLRRGGVFAILKHFPGHGNTAVDSHVDLPVTQHLSHMHGQLFVYEALLDTWRNEVGVMVGHLNVPGLSNGRAASLSEHAIDRLLRQQMGFQGLVITDSLDMGAITKRRNQPSAGLLAILAGADVALVSQLSEQQKLLDVLEQALDSGQLGVARVRASAGRVLGLKRRLTGRPAAWTFCGF